MFDNTVRILFNNINFVFGEKLLNIFSVLRLFGPRRIDGSRDQQTPEKANIQSSWPYKGRTIRKRMGGGGAGEVQKEYSRKGKLNEKKFMHAN